MNQTHWPDFIQRYNVKLKLNYSRGQIAPHPTAPAGGGGPGGGRGFVPAQTDGDVVIQRIMMIMIAIMIMRLWKQHQLLF